jgi:hypothetical protein
VRVPSELLFAALALAGCSSAEIDFDAATDGAVDTSVEVDSSAEDSTVMDSSADTSAVDDAGPSDTGTMDTATGDGGVATPGAGDIVISELMPDSDAAGDDLGEWFELHNPSTTTSFSLDGCSFYDGGGAIEMPSGVVLAPGAYLSFAISPSPGFTPDYVYTSGMRLANPPDPDSLTVSCGATIIDTVAYLPYPSWPWGQGESLSLDPDFLDATANDSVSSWCAGVDEYNRAGGDIDRGTPGMANPECG